jgi:hypothetical protein
MTKHQPDRRIGGRTNGERAQEGGDALLAFADTQYHHQSGEEIPTALADLMCSLLHYLASMGFDPMETLADAVKNGEGHYLDESVYEPHEREDDEEYGEPPFAEHPAYDPEDWMYQQKAGYAPGEWVTKKGGA